MKGGGGVESEDGVMQRTRHLENKQMKKNAAMVAAVAAALLCRSKQHMFKTNTACARQPSAASSAPYSWRWL